MLRLVRSQREHPLVDSARGHGMVSSRVRLIAAALLTGVLFRAADSQEPLSGAWVGLLVGSILSALLLIREVREYQSE